MFSVVDPCRRQRGQWPDLSGTWVQRDGSSSRSLALHYPRAWSRRRSRVRNLQPGRLELAQRGCFLKHSQNIVFTRRLQCVGGDPIYQSCLSCLGLGSPFFFWTYSATSTLSPEASHYTVVSLYACLPYSWPSLPLGCRDTMRRVSAEDYRQSFVCIF